MKANASEDQLAAGTRNDELRAIPVYWRRLVLFSLFSDID